MRCCRFTEREVQSITYMPSIISACCRRCGFDPTEKVDVGVLVLGLGARVERLAWW